jgi:CrcB protein
MLGWLLIAAAGALGTVLRYALGLALAQKLGAAFPYGTLAVNVIGSFALGCVAGAFSGATWLGTDLRLVLGVGLLGGFTTYSSFNLELVRMLEHGELRKAAGYLLGTVLGCLAVGALGLLAGRALAGSSRT